MKASRLRKLLELRSLQTMSGQAIFSATTFISGAIVAKSGGPDQFGVYSLVFISLAWGFSMQGAVVTTPYTFRRQQLSVAEQRDYAGTVLWSQITFALALAVILAVAAGGTALSPSAQVRTFSPVLLTAGAVCGVCLLRECCRQIAFGHEAYASVVALDAGVAVLQLSGLLLLGRAHVMTAVHAFLVIGVAAIVPTAAWLWLHRSIFDMRQYRLGGHAAQSWRFGKWIVAGVFLHSLAKDSFPWILSIMHGTRAAGILGAAFGIAFLVNPILTAVTNMLGPLFARRLVEGGEAALYAQVRSYTWIAIVFALLYSVICMVAGPWLTTLVYGAQYAESGRIAGWLALGIAASVTTLPIGVGLYALHRTNVTFHAVCVAAAIAVVISIPLVSRYAAWGVALALLIENIGESLAKAWWYQKIAHRERTELRSLETPVPV